MKKKYTMTEFSNLPEKEKEKLLIEVLKKSSKDQRDYFIGVGDTVANMRG